MPAMSCVDVLHWNTERRDEAARGQRRAVETCGRPIEHGQAITKASETAAVRPGGRPARRWSAAVVAHGHDQRAALDRGAEDDRRRLDARRRAVADRILDERLYREHRNERVECRRRHRLLHDEAVAEPNALDR